MREGMEGGKEGKRSGEKGRTGEEMQGKVTGKKEREQRKGN